MTDSLPSDGRATLLYVEDEENDVLFMRRALIRAGIRVNFQTAADGDQAIAYLAGEDPHTGRAVPDLVLLDLNLPARSGFEVLHWLRHQPGLRNIPVVVLSSSGRGEDRERARLLGANDYLIKPNSPLRLIDIATELWRRWLAPRAAARGAADGAEIEPTASPVAPAPGAQSSASAPSSQICATIS